MRFAESCLKNNFSAPFARPSRSSRLDPTAESRTAGVAKVLRENRRRNFETAVKIAFVFLLALHALPLVAQTSPAEFVLTEDKIADGKWVTLEKLHWKFRAGDDPAWAAADFDDRGWKTLTNEEINADPTAALENWGGRAWFRLSLQVDESLAGRPLAARVRHWGASEIYLDGELIQSYGAIRPDGTDAEFNPRGVFFPLVFKEGGRHTLAVRYSFKAAGNFTSARTAWLFRANYLPGFRFSIESAEDAGLKLEARTRENRVFFVFIGVFLALALVHFLLYIFYRAAPSNLFCSIFVFGIALSFWLQSLTTGEHSGAVYALATDIARLNVQSLAILFLLAFLYVEFVGRPSRFFWALAALWLVSLFLYSAQLWRQFPYTILMLFLTLADSLRIMLRALAQKRDGAWIIAVGVGVLFVGVAINISVERDFIDIPNWAYELNLYVTVLAVPLSVSVYLARNFARTNRRLERKLAEVQELSARQLEQERREAELRLEHEQTRAENERRARELEEARQLQLSMLPKKVPQLPDLQIAAYMKPATEVGGDYYDFHVSDDGTLTVVVGDATGHGLKAGSVVTATKSLFNAFAPEPSIPEILRQSNLALKKMNLRGLFMAVTMLKMKDRRVSISVAGMPPALVYRAARGEVEEVALRATPLGSIARTVYEQQHFAAEKGDTILLMSDGFPELFDERGEMFDYGRAKETFTENARKSAQEIIDRFVEAGAQWAGARPQDDDITFVVLKVV